MNKTIIRTLLVCIGTPLAFFFLSFILQPRASDVVPGLGLAFSLAGLLYIIPGIILVLVKSSRDIGKGVLLSIALLLVVGFSLCSMNPISIH